MVTSQAADLHLDTSPSSRWRSRSGSQALRPTQSSVSCPGGPVAGFARIRPLVLRTGPSIEVGL